MSPEWTDAEPLITENKQFSCTQHHSHPVRTLMPLLLVVNTDRCRSIRDRGRAFCDLKVGPTRDAAPLPLSYVLCVVAMPTLTLGRALSTHNTVNVVFAICRSWEVYFFFMTGFLLSLFKRTENRVSIWPWKIIKRIFFAQVLPFWSKSLCLCPHSSAFLCQSQEQFAEKRQFSYYNLLQPLASR